MAMEAAGTVGGVRTQPMEEEETMGGGAVETNGRRAVKASGSTIPPGAGSGTIHRCHPLSRGRRHPLLR